MDSHRLDLPTLAQVGEITSFYAYEGGALRSQALLRVARMLAEHDNATAPVLIVDADLQAPGLHHLVDRPEERPGLIEWLEQCADCLHAQRKHLAGDEEAVARQLLERCDWRMHVERIDAGSALYLLRAGRLDDGYASRVAGLDWNTLFRSAPLLLQAWGEDLVRQFRHVLIDLPSGRSPALTALQGILPRKCVALVASDARALAGLSAMMERTKRFRIDQEAFAQPFVLYPLLTDPGARATVQPYLEQLMARTYGWGTVSLSSYLDETALPPAAPLPPAPLQRLLAWHAGDHMAWDSQDEVHLTQAVRAARALPGEGPESGLALATALDALGQYYWADADALQALPCFTEAASLRARHLGESHWLSLTTRLHQAAALCAHDRLADARLAYDLVLDGRSRALGTEHPDTLEARAGLAQLLARQGDWAQALTMHEQVLASLECQLGPEHLHTLDVLEQHAALRARHGELGRARMLYERLLAGRQRVLGIEHRATLASTLALAEVLARCDEPGMARALREQVAAIRARRGLAPLPVANAQLPVGDPVVRLDRDWVAASNGILELESAQATPFAP